MTRARWLALGFAIVIAVAAVIGCGRANNQQQNSVTIKGDDNVIKVSNDGAQAGTSGGNSAETSVKTEAKVRP